MICPRAVLDDIVAHAQEEAPRECCGLLLGRGGRIAASARARNLSATPTRYLIDPEDHIRARRAAREQGVDVVGFYHSHPSGDPVPSPTDLAEASYDQCVWLIVGLRAGVQTGLFAIREGIGTPLDLLVED